jgi:outer membrane protein assembly factor BamA
MKFKLLFVVSILLIFVFKIAYTEQGIYLQKLLIEGNKKTKDEYIRMFITLEEEKSYELDSLLNEINISREKLEETRLFSNIFFNDQIDEENNLILTVQLKERNYYLFGPTGYVSLEDKELEMDSRIYFEHRNLFGRAGIFSVEIPIYEYAGFYFYHLYLINRFRYSFTFDYNHSLTDKNDWVSIVPGASIKIREYVYTGINVGFNIDTPDSFILYPFIEGGFNERYTYKTKSWHYYYLTLFYGLNDDSSSLYGVKSEINLYWDLLLRIVYAFQFNANFQKGKVSESLEFYSSVRGWSFKKHSGNKQIAFTNELHIPFPWKDSIVLVPFIDMNLIGFETIDFLLGGGIGVHWYNKFQNPLVFEIAYGNGIMLNFQKRF